MIRAAVTTGTRPAAASGRMLLAAACFILAACAARREPLTAVPPREYPGTLVLPSSIPVDFIAQQEVRVRHGDRRVRFRSVLQKRGNTITVLGLTPFGSRAFLLQQEGPEVSFTAYVDRQLPFPPRYILLDIHRALFIGIGTGPMADGTHSARRHGEVIRERWREGRVVERTFERESGDPPGLITIRCEDGMLPGVPPSRLTFHNDWFHYDMTILTSSYEELDPRPGSSPQTNTVRPPGRGDGSDFLDDQ